MQNFDKSLAGAYKAVFASGSGEENFATFTVQSGAAPEFCDKPKIVVSRAKFAYFDRHADAQQRDNGNVIVVKVRGKSHIEAAVSWFKVGGS